METTIFTVMGQMVTNTITWMGELLEFIIGQPYILVPMLLFFVAKPFWPAMWQHIVRSANMLENPKAIDTEV